MYPSVSDETISVDSSYRLYVNGNQAVLVNEPNVIDIVNNPVFDVDVVTNSFGQTVLTIGGSDIIILDGSVVTYTLGYYDTLVYLSNNLTGTGNIGQNLFNLQANRVVSYKYTKSIPVLMRDGDWYYGTANMYYRPVDMMAFIVDRQNIINLVTSTLQRLATLVTKMQTTVTIQPNTVILMSTNLVNPTPAPSPILPCVSTFTIKMGISSNVSSIHIIHITSTNCTTCSWIE